MSTSNKLQYQISQIRTKQTVNDVTKLFSCMLSDKQYLTGQTNSVQEPTELEMKKAS